MSEGTCMVIYALRGQPIIVDAQWFPLLSRFTWRVRSTGQYRYALISGPVIRGKRMPHVAMHRVVTSCPKGMIVDHINHDTLDNRSENLRICSVSQNQMNANKRSTNTSGFRGVTKLKTGKWCAKIRIRGKTKNLGHFDTLWQARTMRICAENIYFGEFAPRED